MSFTLDTDNSWLDATLAPEPVKAKTQRKTTGKGLWKMSPEFCEKMSAIGKGRKATAEHCAAISAANKGKKRTAEQRAAMSAARKGRIMTAEHRRRLGLVRAKPIMTPTGVFPSKIAAVRWAEANGLCNADKKINLWLKTHPDMFYLVKKESK